MKQAFNLLFSSWSMTIDIKLPSRFSCLQLLGKFVGLDGQGLDPAWTKREYILSRVKTH